MSYRIPALLTGFVLALTAPAARADDKKDAETAPNPYYTFWAKSKVGSTAVHGETTKLPGPDGKLLPDGAEQKQITYKLVELTPDKAVVETVVTEREFFGFVQAAPTRHIYPAKIKKAYLQNLLDTTGATTGEEMIKFKGKDLKCKTLSGTRKESDGETVEFKAWLSDEVPGGIVKRIRTTKKGADLVAETTTVLESFKAD